MRVCVLVLALGGVAVVANPTAAQSIKAVEGDCVLTGFDGIGFKLTRADLKKVPNARRDAVVAGDKITAPFGDTVETRTFKVDDTQTPHHIDLISTKDGKTVTDYGIYKVEKGVLTICATEPAGAKEAPKEAKDRPTEFKAGRGVYLMTVRKRAEMEGTYLLTGFAAKGFTFGEDDLKKVPGAERQLVIDDDEIVLMFNGKEEVGTFRLDPTATPRHINLSMTREGKTETNYGIYQFEKGTLTICASTKTDIGSRPKEFKADDLTTVLTLRQQPRK